MLGLLATAFLFMTTMNQDKHKLLDVIKQSQFFIFEKLLKYEKISCFYINVIVPLCKMDFATYNLAVLLQHIF